MQRFILGNEIIVDEDFTLDVALSTYPISRSSLR